VLDFSLISQFPDETVKITPAFRAGKVSLFLVENTNYIAVQAVGLIRRLKTVFFAEGDRLCSVSSSRRNLKDAMARQAGNET
jgi:hypothetical protein